MIVKKSKKFRDYRNFQRRNMKKFFLFYEEIISVIVLIFIFFIVRKGSERYTLALVLMGIALIAAIIRKKRNTLSRCLLLSLIGYMILLFLSFVKINFDNKEYFMNYIIYGNFLFLLLSQLKIKEKYYKYYLEFFALCSLIITIKAIKEWKAVGFQPGFRASGDSFPTIFTIEIGIYALIAFTALLYSKGYIKKIVLLGIFGTACVGVIAVNTRSTLITLPLILVGMIVFRYKQSLKKRYLLVPLLAVFIVAQIPDTSKYFLRVKNMRKIENIKKESRLKLWNEGLEKFQENNYKALGYHYFEKNRLVSVVNEKNPHVHNNYLEILVTQGIGAAVFYLLFNIFLLRDMIYRIKKTKIESQKVMNYLGIAVLLFMNLAGLVDANIYFKKANLLAFFIYSLALCSVKKDEVDGNG